MEHNLYDGVESGVYRRESFRGFLEQVAADVLLVPTKFSEQLHATLKGVDVVYFNDEGWVTVRGNGRRVEIGALEKALGEAE